tara:strand:- start:356 stop:538 length:183 start_codon:yes stop_codon:yes gene_type:complete
MRLYIFLRGNIKSSLYEKIKYLVTRGMECMEEKKSWERARCEEIQTDALNVAKKTLEPRG